MLCYYLALLWCVKYLYTLQKVFGLNPSITPPELINFYYYWALYFPLSLLWLAFKEYVCIVFFVGGYTTGPKQVIQMLRQKSRPYLFSNALPPPVVGGASKVSFTGGSWLIIL